MKPVIVFVAALVVATAGGTGAKVMITKPAPVDSTKAKADSTKADSTKIDSTRTDSTQTLKSATDTAVAASGQAVTPPADTLKAKPVAPVAEKSAAEKAAAEKVVAEKAAPTSASTAETAKKIAAIDPADTMATASERRIAKVFTSMDAKQAAKVLEHMSDGDVHIILGYVGVKQAAAIMTALPPERVATLSKLAMSGKGGTK